MNEEIFAYRINESLYCPRCYKEAENNLPKDSGVRLPMIPIKNEDLNLFICNQCKEIKISSEIKVPFPVKIPSLINVINISSEESRTPIEEKGKDLNGLRDMVEDCASKIAFLGDFVSHNIPEDELFSKNGISGFHLILRDLGDNLEFVTNEMSTRQQKGLIIEKELS